MLKSRYEQKLRELGFKPIENLHSREDIEEVDKSVEGLFGTPMPHKLSRADRRRLVALHVLPAFAYIGGDTQAFDEHGREWWVIGHLIDLKPFGFSFNNEEALKLAQSPPPNKRH